MNRSLLQKLYSSGKSMAQIAKTTNCSINKIVYWMQKHGIKRRSRSEANYILYNPNGDPFKIKYNLSKDESFLKGLGMGIYLGEGSKFSKHSLRVANTNPKILRTFRAFLSIVCQLEDKRISYSLITFNDANPEASRQYWAKELRISPEKFGKITQIPKQGKGTYKRKSLYGVCILQAHNVKLRDWLIETLAKLEF